MQFGYIFTHFSCVWYKATSMKQYEVNQTSLLITTPHPPQPENNQPIQMYNTELKINVQNATGNHSIIFTRKQSMTNTYFTDIKRKGKQGVP